ncbi:MAG: glycosyltransferase [Planctomycetota bacterium]|nr:glycosyltransferase [Planctomycetota bacterium]
MRISVVIPSYNHARYIEAAIRSVFVQATNGLEIELVIVDDGSPDDSLPIIRRCLKDSPLHRTVLIEQENRGAHAAIMRGIEHARGDFLSILNSDDAFLPGRFANLAPRLSVEQDCLAFTLVEMIDENDQPLEADAPEFGWYQDVLAGAAACPTRGFALLRNNPAVTSGNFVFSRSLYERLGGFSEHQLSHDWDFLLRSTFYTEPSFIPEVLMRYRVHPQNTTGRVQHLMAQEGRDGLHRFLSLAKSGPSPNPIAPLPSNWPRYWPWFCNAIRPHFSDRPIIENIDQDVLPPRNPDPNMASRAFDSEAQVARPGSMRHDDDPRLREMDLMSRPTPTTDGMNLAQVAPTSQPSVPTAESASLKKAIKRVTPAPILQAAKKVVGTPEPPIPTSGPSVDPAAMQVDPARPVVMVVTQAASRTGGPILALDIVRRLVRDHNAQCAVVYASPGPLLDEFAEVAWLIDGQRLNPWGAPTSYGRAIMSALEQAPQRMAVCNTAPTWYFARWIRRFGWRTLSLIHDFATNSPREDYRLIAESPDVLVYPCDDMRQVACDWADLPREHGVVHPQGLIRESFLDGHNDAARKAFRQRLALDHDVPIVLGCGSLELRKGPELFLLTALAAHRSGLDSRVQFAWIGSGADTYLDPTFWCPRDAARTGIADRMHFIGEVDDTEEAFRASDLYLLTSREDPFPCVVHEAMACGMPVACFEGSGGTPSMLNEGGGAVIPFGDVQAMADMVVQWTSDTDLRHKTGAQARAIVKERYSMDRYVRWLLEQGLT